MPVAEVTPVKRQPVTFAANVPPPVLLSKSTPSKVLLVIENFIDFSVTVPDTALKYAVPSPTVEVAEEGTLTVPPELFAVPVPSPLTTNEPLVLTRLMPTGVWLFEPFALSDLKFMPR